jgi:hypothetical protein
VDVASFGAAVHAVAPHSATGLYTAAAISALLALSFVYARCLWTKSVAQLDEKWIIATAAAAAPIPTYILLLVIPFDADLAKFVLEDRVVVALAGLYGLVETVKDIRSMAATANSKRALGMRQ